MKNINTDIKEECGKGIHIAHLDWAFNCGSDGAELPDEVSNKETLETFAEIKNGGGHKFSGTTDKLFPELLGE